MKKIYRIPQMSKKQVSKNSELRRIKQAHEKECVICGNYGDDLAHLLPKSTFPEYYTLEANLVIMCRTCHNLYDNDVEFRKRRLKLFKQVFGFDQKAAIRYFEMI